MKREEFPVLARWEKLVYLDSANTTLKPQCVIDAVRDYYESYSANIGRATYRLSELATKKYDEVREKVGNFIGASTKEIIFTHSATYGLNQIAFGMSGRLKRGDVILLSLHEHNSNLLVWQQVARETGAVVKFVEEPVDAARVKIFSYALVSNITGQVFEYSDLVHDLRSRGALIAIDATQAVSRMAIDVSALDCDFLVFSSHKIYGPSGVGILYARRELMDEMTPLIYGSQTFADVSRDGFKLLDGVAKFEPGTPNIEGAIGLGVALDFVKSIGFEEIVAHEAELIREFVKAIAESGLEEYLLTDAMPETGVFALNHPRVHPHDIAMLLDTEQIAVRAGKACADLMMQTLGLERGVIRASCGVYTNVDDVRRFVRDYAEAIRRLDG